MVEGPNPGEAIEEEDPTSEAQRFSALLSLLKTNVPELEEWRLSSYRDSQVLGLFEASTLVTEHLFDDDDRPVDVDGVWPRLLAVIEVALGLCDLLFDSARDEDAVAVDVFAGSGIMCHVTRHARSIETLLPWMGPVSLDSARIEINNHTISRGYDVDDVDWSRSGISYRPLGISPLTLLPAQRI